MFKLVAPASGQTGTHTLFAINEANPGGANVVWLGYTLLGNLKADLEFRVEGGAKQAWGMILRL
jgi:hypothetical protein